MRHIYHSEQWLPYPIELVFAFFANPENLPRLMLAWQKARIEEASFAPPPPTPWSTGSTPSLKDPRFTGIAVGAGTRITLSFRPFPYSPVRIPWEAEITDFTWNDRFCDHQLRGPFAYWHHCHSVSPETRTVSSQEPINKEPINGTLLRDHVEYEMLWGKLGELGRPLFMSRQLANTFSYRHKRTQELLALQQAHPAPQ
jgi:ligand-binding SRPBCC domain-containing protein